VRAQSQGSPIKGEETAQPPKEQKMKKIMALGIASLLFSACTYDNSRQQPTDKEEKGKILIPTTSVSSSGNIYTISVDHMHLSSDSKEYDLSFDASPFEDEVFEVSLRADLWTATLNDYALYRYDSSTGDFNYVESFVESPNPQIVEVFSGETSTAHFIIRTNEDVVVFDQGDIAFTFEVRDTTDADGDGWTAADDCNDEDPSIFPGADEIVDETDNDCDGIIDNVSDFDLDSDGDGLSDGDEIYFHETDPNSIDSDYDGVDDFSEIFEYDTNPLNVDTDEDYALDGEEIYEMGTDVHSWDSDGDGLSDGEEILFGLSPLEYQSPVDIELYMLEVMGFTDASWTEVAFGFEREKVMHEEEGPCTKPQTMSGWNCNNVHAWINTCRANQCNAKLTIEYEGWWSEQILGNQWFCKVECY